MAAEKSASVLKALWSQWVNQECPDLKASYDEQADRFLKLCLREKSRRDSKVTGQTKEAAKARAAFQVPTAVEPAGPVQTVKGWLGERGHRAPTLVQTRFRLAVLWFFQTQLAGVSLDALAAAWKEDAERGGDSEEPEPAPITPWVITPVLDSDPLAQVVLHQPGRLNSEPNTYIVKATLEVGVQDHREEDVTYVIGMTKVTADFRYDKDQWEIVQSSRYGQGEDRPEGVTHPIGGITFTQPIDVETECLASGDLLQGNPLLRIALKEGAKGDKPLYLSLVAPSRTFRIVQLDDTGKVIHVEDSTKVKEALLNQLLKLKASDASGKIVVAQGKMQRKDADEADGG